MEDGTRSGNPGTEFCSAWSLGPSGSAERELVWLFVGGGMARVLVPRQLPFLASVSSKASTSYLVWPPGSVRPLCQSIPNQTGQFRTELPPFRNELELRRCIRPAFYPGPCRAPLLMAR